MLRGNSVSSLQQDFCLFGHFPHFVDLILEWIAGPRVDGVINRNQSNQKKKKRRKLKSSKLDAGSHPWTLIHLQPLPRTLTNLFLNSTSFASCACSPSCLLLLPLSQTHPSSPASLGCLFAFIRTCLQYCRLSTTPAQSQ